jgi:predicted AAA+ superfamily ATPase
METFILPPLTFLEFVRFRYTEEKLFYLRDGKEDALVMAKGLRGKIAIRKGALPHLNADFHRYVNFGSFLEGVLGHQRKGAPAPTFIRDGVADRMPHKDLADMVQHQ